MVALEVERLAAVAAKGRMSDGGRGGKNATPSKARDDAAEALNVSPRSVQSAKRIKAEALETVPLG